MSCLALPLAPRSEPIVLRVGGAGGFKLPDKNATDPKSRADRAIVDAFERAHPDIRLESAQGLQIGGPAAESNLLLAFAGGTAPDVVYVNFRSSASYIQQGFLMPLDDYLKRDPAVLARIKPTLLPILQGRRARAHLQHSLSRRRAGALLPQRHVPGGGAGPGQAARATGTSSMPTRRR